MTLIAGGIVMLVQPWSLDLYSYSFVTILFLDLMLGIVLNGLYFTLWPEPPSLI